jgi:hypothetical protein
MASPIHGKIQLAELSVVVARKHNPALHFLRVTTVSDHITANLDTHAEIDALRYHCGGANELLQRWRRLLRTGVTRHPGSVAG